jgi:hypothetical protein
MGMSAQPSCIQVNGTARTEIPARDGATGQGKCSCSPHSTDKREETDHHLCTTSHSCVIILPIALVRP